MLACQTTHDTFVGKSGFGAIVAAYKGVREFGEMKKMTSKTTA